MPGVLQEKVAVITGGTSGIGLAIAHRFVREGARVFVTGRDIDRLEAAVKEMGPAATGVRSDVSILADLDALYARVREEAGRIDVLVANAGIVADAALGAHTEANVDLTLAVNVKGPLFTVQKALPLLAENASILVIGSSNSVRPNEHLEVYSASKAALSNLVHNWARQSRERRFRVNVLSPGPTRTPALLRAAGRTSTGSPRPSCHWGDWPTPRKSPRPPSSLLRTPRRSSPAPNSSPTAATPGPERRPVVRIRFPRSDGAHSRPRVCVVRGPVRSKQRDRGRGRFG